MRAMPFFGKIKDHVFQFISPKTFAGYCKLQKDGDYTMTLTKTIPGKTNEQLGYFHAVVAPVVFNQIKEFYGLEKDEFGNKKKPTVCFMVKDKMKQIPMNM